MIDRMLLALLTALSVVLVLVTPAAAMDLTRPGSPPTVASDVAYGVTVTSPCTTRLVVTSSTYGFPHQVWSGGVLLGAGTALPGRPSVYRLDVAKRQPVLVYGDAWGVISLTVRAASRPCR